MSTESQPSQESRNPTLSPPGGPRGPVQQAERALAPDLARGMMLLFIAVANAVGVVFGGELAGQPNPHGVERVANLIMFSTVHARAYPMFAVLFGYGLVQLATRQQARTDGISAAHRILLRRNLLLVVFGAAHALLLYSGDFLGAYGLAGILATVLLLPLRPKLERVLLWIWAACVPYVLVMGGLVVARWMTASGPAADLPEKPTESLRATTYLDSLIDRIGEWPVHTLTVLPFIMIVWLGIWAARRGILEEPAAHRVLLRRVAVGGLTIAFLGGLPLGLVSAGLVSADADTLQLMTLLQGASGMFGGPGYVALFGLLAAWVARTVSAPGSHPLTGSLAALGQRSLSGYLFQSLAWLVLFAPFTLALGRHGSPVLTAIALGTATWLVTVIAAFWLERRRLPGPAEKLLRRLTYGARAVARS